MNKADPCSDSNAALSTVAQLLELTRNREFDCDEFHDLLAAWLEGGLTDATRIALMKHHSAICPECEEERLILARCLGITP